MAWFKVDDNFAFHTKVLTLPSGAVGLWVRAGSWCAQQLTDGVLPAGMLAAFGASESDAEALVDAGLWKPTESGWLFHDWLEYQPSRQQVEAERAAGRERQRRARDAAKARREAERNAVTNGVTSGAVTAESRRPSRSPRPDPTRPEVPNGTTPQQPLPQSGPETDTQRAQRLTRTYTERVKLSNFAAVMGVVKKAIGAEYADQPIIEALGRLASDGRPVTTDTLRMELEGLPTRTRGSPNGSVQDVLTRSMQRAEKAEGLT